MKVWSKPFETNLNIWIDDDDHVVTFAKTGLYGEPATFELKLKEFDALLAVMNELRPKLVDNTKKYKERKDED